MCVNAFRNLINRRLVGWFCVVSAGLLASSSASAGFVFTSGTDSNAGSTGGYAAVRDRNFSNGNGHNGEVYIGTQSNLGGGPRGDNQNVAWTQNTYDFTYTYDPTDKIAATTWTVHNSGNPNTSSQSITVPSAAANELQILDRNTLGGELTLTLTSINSVGYGGTLSGTGGSTVVTGGTRQFDGATWNGANSYLNAYLKDDNLFNSGFELFGTITVGASTDSNHYGNNESSKIEIDLANVPTSSAAVPEPSTISLAALGVAAVVALRWRTRNRNVAKTAG